ncbi:MAG: three-Cys-motif partner protein TcmP [Acidobacteria bacterium]|nr:three-Cys-motif partner protein TcmP [Acidobacteriota bacterium]
MRFGGPWTIEKLDILEAYLDAYTTALKSQPFSLIYIDAFAGTGQVELRVEDRDTIDFLRGSTERAIGIRDKPFDELIFVEKDPARYAVLEGLRSKHPKRNIIIEKGDANLVLDRLDGDWRGRRGVLFLDPFATQVEWATLERIADLKALDTWILFPVSAVVRMLPTSRKPDDISQRWAARLTSVFGDDSWRELYRERSQQNLFGDPGSVRDSGVHGLMGIYRRNLRELFGDRFLDQSRALKNSTGSHLFEFMFCVGHPRGIRPAKRIARHILLDRM